MLDKLHKVLLSHHNTIESIRVVSSVVRTLTICILGKEGAKVRLPRVDIISYIIDDLIHLSLIVYISHFNF